MKFNKIFSLLMAGATLVFTACDDVKEADRYIDLGSIEAERNVLLVDFTGQNCRNCPTAHEVIEQLEDQYNQDGKEHLIAVSIHSAPLGIDTRATNFTTGNVGLMTTTGNALATYFGINSQPLGIVDLTGSPLLSDNWAATIRSAMERSTDIKLSTTAEFTPGENDTYGEANGISGTITMSMDVLTDADKPDIKVQFWILENGIAARQLEPSGNLNSAYIHNNVYRAQVWDGLGQDVELVANTSTTFKATIDARFTNKERWMVNNLSIVAYVYGSEGVLQVVRVPVTVPTDYEQPEPTV